MSQTLVGTAALLIATVGLTFGLSMVSDRLLVIPSVELATGGHTELPTDLDLAQAFTAALNAHDVELFTDEDSGPTVTADRAAWQRFEIALWAQQQVSANVRIDAFDYRPTEHGVAWAADVSRDDWYALGLESLRVSNTIWVHHSKLANFTSHASDPRDLQRLGSRWRPGAAPERTALVCTR